MKKIYLILAMIMSAAQMSFADSPLTSTEFYKAYLDVPIVKAAADSPKKLSEEAKAYLFDEGNPLDVKIALINAVGWDIEGLSTYSDYIQYCLNNFPRGKYGIDENEIVRIEDVYNNASCEQMAMLVYLFAMSDYSNTQAMYNLMEQAMLTPLMNKQSFMLPMGLIIAQTALVSNDRGRIYPAMNFYINSPEIKDMRPKAIELVMEYINEYKEYANE